MGDPRSAHEHEHACDVRVTTGRSQSSPHRLTIDKRTRSNSSAEQLSAAGRISLAECSKGGNDDTDTDADCGRRPREFFPCREEKMPDGAGGEAPHPAGA